MPLVKVIDGKKFMWDGAEREDGKQACDALEKYESAGFEARLIEEGGKYCLYTRKVVAEVKVEGGPTVS